eukprot:TRINITY_DN2785_c0_g1_i1.p1 TRINITY_DN2785_c0_g1~~TRINITY_DN2785_c0_g1_i1.p1  ORF type:complete len:1055 (+),score=268.45 TRINITY_DN2785_c0_g1_i1:416-3166(+)
MSVSSNPSSDTSADEASSDGSDIDLPIQGTMGVDPDALTGLRYKSQRKLLRNVHEEVLGDRQQRSKALLKSSEAQANPSAFSQGQVKNFLSHSKLRMHATSLRETVGNSFKKGLVETSNADVPSTLDISGIRKIRGEESRYFYFGPKKQPDEEKEKPGDDADLQTAIKMSLEVEEASTKRKMLPPDTHAKKPRFADEDDELQAAIRLSLQVAEADAGMPRPDKQKDGVIEKPKEQINAQDDTDGGFFLEDDNDGEPVRPDKPADRQDGDTGNPKEQSNAQDDPDGGFFLDDDSDGEKVRSDKPADKQDGDTENPKEESEIKDDTDGGFFLDGDSDGERVRNDKPADVPPAHRQDGDSENPKEQSEIKDHPDGDSDGEKIRSDQPVQNPKEQSDTDGGFFSDDDEKVHSGKPTITTPEDMSDTPVEKPAEPSLTRRFMPGSTPATAASAHEDEEDSEWLSLCSAGTSQEQAEEIKLDQPQEHKAAENNDWLSLCSAGTPQKQAEAIKLDQPQEEDSDDSDWLSLYDDAPQKEAEGKGEIQEAKEVENRVAQNVKKLADLRYRSLQQQAEMQKEHREALRKAGANMADTIIEDTKEILDLFGIPYITAPGEADSQLGMLCQTGLVDAVATEDSDVFLFGAKRVIRGLGSKSKAGYPTEVTMDKVVSTLGYSKRHLIALAMMVGSDYTEGLRRVGMNAAQHLLMVAQPSETSQASDMDYVKGVMSNVSKYIKDEKAELFPDNTGFWRTQVLRKISEHGKKAVKAKNMTPSDPHFPNENVMKAYLQPTVDESREQFTWGTPLWDKLLQYGKERTGIPTVDLSKMLDKVQSRYQFGTFPLLRIFPSPPHQHSPLSAVVASYLSFTNPADTCTAKHLAVLVAYLNGNPRLTSSTKQNQKKMNDPCLEAVMKAVLIMKGKAAL